MKLKVAIFFVSVWILSAAPGCQRPTTTHFRGDDKVILPPEIAGTWKAYDSLWKIVLSPDGRVVSAVIPMCQAEVKPNQTTKVEMLDGQFSSFKAGDFLVEYVPDTRELFVSIEIEKLHLVILDNVLDGNSVDRFVGPVSEDGKEWQADWINLFDYGPRFPQDQNDIGEIYPGVLIFEKVEDPNKK